MSLMSPSKYFLFVKIDTPTAPAFWYPSTTSIIFVSLLILLLDGDFLLNSHIIPLGLFNIEFFNEIHCLENKLLFSSNVTGILEDKSFSSIFYQFFEVGNYIFLLVQD